MLSLFTTTLPETSTIAPRVQNLFDFIAWFSIISGTVLVAMAIYFIIRYRRRSHEDKTPQIEGHRPTEIAFSAVLFVVVM
ncbi:MAG: cytochrome c oxidase subunit II, partial [bacterium]|nr:cytochrome c oxidase subunit II [bacterium]